MATTRLVLDRALHKDGTALIRIILSNGKKVSRISTGFSIMPYQWQEDKSRVINHPAAERINLELQKKLAEAQIAMINDQASGSLSLQRVRNVLDPQRESSADILDIFSLMIEDPRKAFNTKELYAYARNKVELFARDCKKTTDINSIDLAWLDAFDKWLASGKASSKGKPISGNSRKQIFNELKKAFTEAQLRNLTTNYPFRLFHIKGEQTRKRALTIDVLRALLYGNCSRTNEKYQDYAKLVFYLRGINLKDLIYLTDETSREGFIEYRRFKTGRLYQIKIEPEIREILDKYKRKGSPYILPIPEKYREGDYRGYGQIFNQGLRAILKKNLPDCEQKISSYWLRHSWASIASGLDIPKEIISEGLGHEIGSSITSIYIDFDQTKVDKANRQIMDYVLYDKK